MSFYLKSIAGIGWDGMGYGRRVSVQPSRGFLELSGCRSCQLNVVAHYDKELEEWMIGKSVVSGPPILFRHVTSRL